MPCKSQLKRKTWEFKIWKSLSESYVAEILQDFQCREDFHCFFEFLLLWRRWRCNRKNFVFLFGALINLTVRVDAYFHSMRMTYPIHPGPFSGQHQIGEKPPNTFFLKTFQKGQTYLLSALFISSYITTPWGKPSNLWTSWVYSHRPRVPSWIWIWWIQYATHRNHFKSSPTLAMSIATQNLSQTSSYFIPGQHFLETYFSPQTTRTTHSLVTTSFLSLTSKHDFCYTSSDHISLTHSTMP